MKTLFSNFFKKSSNKDDSIKNKTAVVQVYNRSVFSSHLDTFLPSDLQEMVLIFIQLDTFEALIKQSGKKVANAILTNFNLEVTNAAGENNMVVQWSEQSLLLACPKTTIEQARVTAKKVKRIIQDKTWKKNVKVNCSIGIAEVADEPLYSIISRIKSKIDVQRGNAFFVDKAKAKHQHQQTGTTSAKTVTSKVMASKTVTSKVMASKTATSEKKQSQSLTSPPLSESTVKSNVKRKICAVTGALTEDGLTHYLTDLSPELKQIMKVIVIDIANLPDLIKQYGQTRADEVSQKVAHEIFMKSMSSHTLGTWDKKQFLLTSTNTNLNQANAFAADIESVIENRSWLTSINIEINTETFDANDRDLMSLSKSSVKVNKIDNTSHDLVDMTCPSTGALNQAGITSFLEQCNSNVLQEMSVIFIALDAVDNSHNTKITESISQQFVNYINQTFSLSIITRLSIKEYLLVCPKTTIEQATQQTEEIRSAVTINDWSDGVLLSCKAEVYDKNWHEYDQNPAALSDAQEFVADNIVRIFAA